MDGREGEREGEGGDVEVMIGQMKVETRLDCY